MYLPSGIAIELQRTFPKETLVHILETCIRLFLVAALFIITKTGNLMGTSNRLVKLIVAYSFGRKLQRREN